MINVAINGFGRIGRAFFRAAWDDDRMHVSAINDLGSPENLAYLLKYDSVYGQAPFTVKVENKSLYVDNTCIPLLSEKNPGKLPWKDHNIDVVVESTGVFAEFEKSEPHLDAGAKRVVISAPVKEDAPAGLNAATVLMGINEDLLENIDVSSNASCTTNAGSPLVQILHEAIGIEKAMLNTVHGYTASQSIVDGPHNKDPRRGRAAAVNIVPTSTGAAKATTKAITDLDGKFDGVAMRVPVPAGSVADITFIASKHTTVEEVNDTLRNAAQDARWSKVFATTEEPLVSTDIIGEPHASIADLSMTRVVDGNLVKVLAWYDNEAGYVQSLLEHVAATGKFVTK